jgi:asparagine synthase (glutamine-hydrolysing)
MLAALHHRGPDGSGLLSRDGIGIAMTRLAIIDVAGGQQPIYNETETIAVVCNGEIYNHAELRAELERRGHRFRTHSDVEVILHLYEEVGEACFERLNGMFGVAIADFTNNRLVLARDPFGQKPLYLWHGPYGWVFASELKALTRAQGFSKRVSPNALAAFLEFRYVPAPLSIFDGVRKLQPGSVCTIEGAEEPRERRYFQLSFGPESVGRLHDPDGSLTRNALMASVERHLMSERPLGVFLSGGVDSSAIVACMHMNGHRDIRTFTVGFKDFHDNELGTGALVAQHFKTTHSEVLLDAETFWQTMDEVVYAADEPLADLTTVPLFHLSKLARRDVTVVLSGEGADELLAGYNDFHLVRRQAELRGRLRRFAPVARMLRTLPMSATLQRKLETVCDSEADYLARTHVSATSVFSNDFRQRYCEESVGGSAVLEPLEQYYRQRQSWDGVHLSMGCMVEWWLPDDLLHKADRMTMANSIESRCPFLDLEFARHCASLSLDSKVTTSKSEPNRKRALKLAFMNQLPAGLVVRKKRGFSIPAYEWLRTAYKERASQEMMRNDALGSSLVPSAVRHDLLQQALAGSVADQRRIWSLLVLNKWGDVWL